MPPNRSSKARTLPFEAVESIIDSAKEASDASATSVAARDVAKAAQNAATQQGHAGRPEQGRCWSWTQQAKIYADEAAGYAARQSILSAIPATADLHFS